MSRIGRRKRQARIEQARALQESRRIPDHIAAQMIAEAIEGLNNAPAGPSTDKYLRGGEFIPDKLVKG